jgi:hypothetical protein
MKNAIRNTAAVLLAGFAVAGSAHAAYVCDNPPTPVDQRACAAAEEGPEVLRRFIQNIRPVHNLYFYDYVNEARLVAWQEQEARARALADAGKTSTAATNRNPR